MGFVFVSVKLVDFGFGMVADDCPPVRPCKYLRGTPGYMAPEVISIGPTMVPLPSLLMVNSKHKHDDLACFLPVYYHSVVSALVAPPFFVSNLFQCETFRASPSVWCVVYDADCGAGTFAVATAVITILFEIANFILIGIVIVIVTSVEILAIVMDVVATCFAVTDSAARPVLDCRRRVELGRGAVHPSVGHDALQLQE